MKLLIGGSPCTHWSIAQTKNRETEASGIGWELFLNYRIARDKHKPNFFLYENNKSMSPAIRELRRRISGRSIGCWTSEEGVGKWMARFSEWVIPVWMYSTGGWRTAFYRGRKCLEGSRNDKL